MTWLSDALHSKPQQFLPDSLHSRVTSGCGSRKHHQFWMIWRSPILGIPKLTQAKWAPKKGSNKQSVLLVILVQQDVMLLHLFGAWSAIVFATSHYHQWSTTIKPRLPLIIPNYPMKSPNFPCRSPASVHLSAPSASCHRRWSDAKPWRFSVADATQRQGTVRWSRCCCGCCGMGEAMDRKPWLLPIDTLW